MEATPIPDKLYYPAVPKSAMAQFRETLREAGVQELGDGEEDWDFGVADELISATVDCSEYAARHYAALEAHASQGDGTFFTRLGVDLFSKLMSREMFVRAFEPTGAPVPETDLFAGLRY
jgi:LmbE family N-acetylglucosaminyl deacetylase